MLRNYFKIAIAVLKRRKFFTFISLFGISFTLTILVVLAAFIDKVVGDNYPDRKRSRSLYINNLEETGKQDFNSGAMSYYFLNHYTAMLKKPEKVAISSAAQGTNAYVNDKKIAINYKYTNAAFWDIMEFDFVEGKPFSPEQVLAGEHVVVISEQTKRKYFGDGQSVVGQYIEADNEKYRISGVVKDVPITLYMIYSDIYMPYTLSRADYRSRGYLGSYTAVLLAPSASDVDAMRDEYEQLIRRIPMESNNYTKIFSHADSFVAGYVRTGNEEHSGVVIALTAVAVFAFLVMLLPTLNLVSINVTRIMERSSEIGVRKAFGASSKTLVYQFMVENLIITGIGGIIGCVLSAIVLYFINDAMLIPNLVLSLNFTVVGIALLICLVFGLFSGVYPAWRMSRLNVVAALKS